jgi:hypothetical protein
MDEASVATSSQLKRKDLSYTERPFRKAKTHDYEIEQHRTQKRLQRWLHKKLHKKLHSRLIFFSFSFPLPSQQNQIDAMLQKCRAADFATTGSAYDYHCHCQSQVRCRTRSRVRTLSVPGESTEVTE